MRDAMGSSVGRGPGKRGFPFGHGHRTTSVARHPPDDRRGLGRSYPQSLSTNSHGQPSSSDGKQTRLSHRGPDHQVGSEQAGRLLAVDLHVATCSKQHRHRRLGKVWLVRTGRRRSQQYRGATRAGGPSVVFTFSTAPALAGERHAR
jgi:hypothetical protein